MITKPREIYKNVSEKYELPIELIQSIGNTIFQKTRSILNRPDDLAYELPELGVFNIRFCKFERYIYNIRNNPQEDEFRERMKYLIKRMDEYREDKQNIKEKRNNYDKTNESSKD